MRQDPSIASFARAAAFGLVLTLALAAPVAAMADGPFSSLTGSWSGTGSVKFSGGQSEPIRCKLYYNPKSGSELALALRCASSSAKIEMRANLVSSGGNLSGTWEERSYNASGSVTGKAAANSLSMKIEGGGLTGSMHVNVNGASQSVSITTNGAGFTGVNLSFSKS